MRTLTYLVASTLDGFIADPHGSDPSPPHGFFPDGDHMRAILDDYPEILPTPARRALGIDAENRRFDTVLEGRGSYEIGLRAGITNAYQHLRHYVFSQSITTSPDPDVRIVATDPVEKVHELKQRDGLGIWLCGGGQLAGALFPEIDELVIKLNPVVIGSGTPLFRREFQPEHFTLRHSRSFDSGVLFLTYTRT